MISPLLANLYLHWFDKLFHGPKGRPNGRMPSWCVMPMILWCWRNRWDSETIEFIESRAGREVPVGDQSGEDARGGPAGGRSESGLSGIHVSLRPRSERARVGKYLNVFPSKKAVQREREKLHEMTDQSSVLQADPDTDWRAESAPERLGELLLLWVLRAAPSVRSTGTFAIV